MPLLTRFCGLGSPRSVIENCKLRIENRKLLSAARPAWHTEIRRQVPGTLRLHVTHPSRGNFQFSIFNFQFSISGPTRAKSLTETATCRDRPSLGLVT